MMQSVRRAFQAVAGQRALSTARAVQMPVQSLDYSDAFQLRGKSDFHPANSTWISTPPPFLSQLLFTLPEVVHFLSVAHSILNKILYFIIAGPYFVQHYESCERGYFSSAAVQVGSANLLVI